MALLLLWQQLIISATIIASSLAIFIGGEQDVGSPLRVAQCRATCLERFSNDGPNGESMCLQGPDCFMCWENCELLQSNFQVWGAMCEEKEICFPGCQEACRFHAEASLNHQQTQPVIHTKGEGVIQVSGALARWPRPSSVDRKTPLVYVVMIKSHQGGVWRQIIQTLDLTTRVPLNSDKLRVLVVDAQGLVTIYSPENNTSNNNNNNNKGGVNKKKKTINTEIIKATTSKTLSRDNDSNNNESPWILREISLIHQKVLVIGEIAWQPKSSRGVYLVTWEVDGGGLKGNLFTDSTCVTLSLWPDTIYHIQVELVSHLPGVENLKSEMMDLDTGRAQKVSTESQDAEDLGFGSNNEIGGNDEDVDFNSPLLSVLVSAVRGENARKRWDNMELVLGSGAAVVVFALLVVAVLWRWRSRSGIRRRKLVEDAGDGYGGFRPIISVMSSTTPKLSVYEPPEVVFQGATDNTSSSSSSASSSSLSDTDKTCSSRHEVQV